MLSTVPQDKGYVALLVFLVGFLVAWPLWREFSEPQRPLWNVILAALLIALVITAFLGVRYLQKNRIEVGEARFASKDQTDRSEG